MCPNGHKTPKEFAPGTQIRCPYVSLDGINCDAVYTVGTAAHNAPRPADAKPGKTRKIG